MAIISGAVAILMFVAAAIAPPPWEVHASILQGMGICVGIQALFEAMVALEAGVDAKVTHENGKTSVAIDGNGDGKTPEA